jgi:hypothetical protein
MTPHLLDLEKCVPPEGNLFVLVIPFYTITRCRAPFGRVCFMTHRLASLFLLLFSPCSVSAACIYAFIYILGVLFTCRLASLFLLLFSPRTVSAACIYASSYAYGA